MDYDVETDMIVRAYGKEFEEVARRDIVYVNHFCKLLGVELTNVGIMQESGKPELAYEFSDGMGYYNISGLEASISKGI